MKQDIAKRKLVLITDEFPNSLGESTFVPPELPFLLQRFDVTVLCKSASKTQKVAADPRIHLLHYDRPVPLLHLPDLIHALFTPDFREEWKRIKASGGQRLLRAAVSAFFISEARLFDRFLSRAGFYGAKAPDIFYSYWNNYAVYALVMAKAAGRTRAKLVTRTHGYDLYHQRQPGSRQPMKQQTDRGLDRVFFVSEQGRRYYIDQHTDGRDESKYALFRMGVSAAKPCPPPPEGDALRVLSCSNALPVKRLDLLIRALAAVDDIPVRWTHVGGGPELPQLKDMATRLLSDKENISFTFLGGMENADYLTMLENHPFSCFVNVSSSEGLPVTMMEACSRGLPIIATNVGGVSEIVSEKNGILLPADPSAEEIARVLTAFYALPEEEKRALSAGAQAVWAERFHAEQNYAAFAEALYALCVE